MPIDGKKVLREFLLGKKPLTVAAYTKDLEDFRIHIGESTIPAAIERLFGHGHVKAQELMAGYRAKMTSGEGLGRDLAPASVNRRLSTLRSLGKQTRIMGLIPWVLDAKNEKPGTVRDSRGPGREAVEQVFRHFWSLPATAPVLRDLGILHLLYDLGLRRGEISGLDLGHVVGAAVMVKAKGKRTRQPLELPLATQESLQAWIRVRRGRDQALFVNFDTVHASKTGKRLTGSAIAAMLKTRATAAGLPPEIAKLFHPHGIRHTAITEALKAGVKAGHRIDEIAQFSRHADPRTMFKYIDKEGNIQGKLSAAIAIRRN
jgi:integrase